MTQDSTDTCRVMVVDDSAVIRGLVTRACESRSGVRVVASASNGEYAIKSLERTPVDVVILDIEMPVMDGLTAIPLLKKVDPAVQILMASTLTQKNADISIKAMQLGATDYIPKPTSTRDAGMEDFTREIAEKVIVLGHIARKKGVRATSVGTVARPLSITTPAIGPAAGAVKSVTLRHSPIKRPDIIAIGSSTGGPQALFEVIKVMGAGLPQPVVITQHMPPTFVTILAEHIERQCNVVCAEAKEGDILKAGRYYLAPGDAHLHLVKRAEGIVATLSKGPPENFCRPAVDPMLRSLVDVYGDKILVVILTGMGQDGCKGSDLVVKAGGAVLAQDEASSVVWGMPGAVATAGLCSALYPVSEMGNAVRQIAMKVS